MQSDRFVVIMAGGKGERFWPQSRLQCPKQLLPIVGDQPLLVQTVQRLRKVVPLENVMVITNADQVEAVRRVCPMLQPENIVAEPVGRDTAAAVGLAAILVKQRHADGVFAVIPSDQVIHDEEAFAGVMDAAFEVAAQDDVIVTVGIQPDYPATGYGYIWHHLKGDQVNDCTVYDVKDFVEKPDLETAKEYLATGEFFWNAGMFIWRVPVINAELEINAPELWEGLQQIEAGLLQGTPLHDLLAQIYPTLQKISIDYAVMEKAESVKVVESTFDWDDVGEWPAVARHSDADAAGNVGNGLVKLLHSKGNIVVGEKDHLLALVGVDDLIVVQTKDATLICSKEKAQEIKALIGEIQSDPRLKHLL